MDARGKVQPLLLATKRGSSVSDTPPPEPVAESETEPEDWLPPLLLMSDYEDKWQVYVEAVYTFFRNDFYARPLLFRGLRVSCRRDPICQNKEAGFWHCVSEGRNEAERTPDLNRCKRILWLRAIIERAGTDKRIDVWQNALRGENRVYLWFDDEYLIVLADRKKYFQLITAFTTETEHTRRKLRRERDESQKEAENG
jgi:hypothetical protein